MDRLVHFKLWNADLGQYVAQRDRLPRELVRSLGGIVIAPIEDTSPLERDPISRSIEQSSAHGGLQEFTK